jgi:hypothetical protein
MPTKLNKQVIIDFLKEHNCTLESEYINTKTPIKFRLPCGHINKSKYDLMKRGDGSHFICDTCYPTSKNQKLLRNLGGYGISKDDTTRYRYDKHVYKHLRIEFSKNFNSSLKYRKDFDPFMSHYVDIECKNCLLTKHRSLFYNSNLYKSRKRPICKKCNVTDKKERVENYTLDQHIHFMIYTARQSAKKRSKKYINKGEVSITPQDIHDLIKIQNNKCVFTKVNLVWEVNAPPFYKASLDRIDSDKGYTKDNVQLVSHSTNTAKSDMTSSEWLLFRQKLSENL